MDDDAAVRVAAIRHRVNGFLPGVELLRLPPESLARAIDDRGEDVIWLLAALAAAEAERDQLEQYRQATLNGWEVERLEHADTKRERDKLREHILDIAAHATPYGDLPAEPGWVGTYLLTAGALHRALGTLGHTAPAEEDVRG